MSKEDNSKKISTNIEDIKIDVYFKNKKIGYIKSSFFIKKAINDLTC
jgi:hypothetical protein